MNCSWCAERFDDRREAACPSGTVVDEWRCLASSQHGLHFIRLDMEECHAEKVTCRGFSCLLVVTRITAWPSASQEGPFGIHAARRGQLAVSQPLNQSKYFNNPT